MRAEDKRLGVDHDQGLAEQTRRQDRAHATEELLETGDDRVTEQDRQYEIAKAERCAGMMAVVAALFRRDMRPLDGLTGFSAEEMEALRYLEAAVSGRDAKLTHLIYAEDRRDLLEQALAVLYPTLSHGLEQSVDDGVREVHAELIANVTSLRGHLADVADAQEDVIEMRQRIEEEATAGDDDKDDDDDKPDDAADVTRPTDDDDDEPRRGDVGDAGVAP